MLIRSQWSHVAAAAVCGALLCSTPAWAQRTSTSNLDNDVTLIETEISGLERRVGSLRADLSGGSLTRSPRKITERYNEAKYAYLVEQYELCGLYFFSLLENEDLQGDARRPEAEWFLAECLFMDGNLSPAQDQFRRIVDQGQSHPFYSDSLLKLIELYGRTGAIEQFNRYYNSFVRSSQDSSPTALRIRYEMGKTLFRQGKLGDAMAIFAPFPTGSTFTPMARYFSGTILVSEGQSAMARGEEAIARQKFQQAITVFTEVLTLPISTDAHVRVQNLTHLAIARLHYETGDIPKAIGEYTQIPSDSEAYDDALYEMIWANIEAASQMVDLDASASNPAGKEAGVGFERQRKYEEALRAIEIFNLAFPDDPRDSALRLLAGHVRVRMEKYDGAITHYETAAGHFRELKDQVDAIVTSGADSMVYFNQLVDDEYVAEADLTVPRSARQQAQRDEKVAVAVAVAGDLYRQQSDIDQASDRLDILEEALFANEGKGLIQTYRIHRQQLASAEGAMLLLRNRLIQVEMQWLEANVSGSSRGALDTIARQKDDASRAATELSSRRQDSVERQEVFNLQAQAVQTRMYHIELAISDLRGRLTAIEEYLVDARSRGERSREEELEARAQIERERSDLEETLAALVELRKRVEPRVLTARLASEMLGTDEENSARSDTSDAIQSVESRLGGLRGSASGGTEFFRRLDGARSRLLDLERLTVETQDLMDRAESKELTDIRKEVDFQRRTVGALFDEGQVVDGDNTRVSGRIGRQAFVDVAAFYEDMLTRSDMGVIDVYWYRKESTSKRKKELAREKNRRLRALRDAFSDVLEER